MAAFDQLKSFSHHGIAFPVKRVSTQGALRDHVHEYPHSPGGAPEKLGRKLYEFSVEAPFLQGLKNPRWASLWPTQLGVLMKLWEAGTTGPLHIPTIGTIPAYAINWTREMSATVRNGEMVSVTFREDQTQAVLINSLVEVSPVSVESKLADLQLEVESLAAPPDIFDGINDSAAAIFAIGDQFQLAGSYVEAKILGLVALLREADEQLNILDEPVNHRILDALHELWLSAVQLHENVQAKRAKIKQFTVPVRMAVSDISTSIYGDTAKGGEILQLNALEDPFAVPAGTVVRYYEASAA